VEPANTKARLLEGASNYRLAASGVISKALERASEAIGEGEFGYEIVVD
jgi:hypothetical protein